MKTKKFVCIKCNRVYSLPVSAMPLVTLEGPVCGNICLTNWFRDKVSEAEQPFNVWGRYANLESTRIKHSNDARK